ncbi:MAG: tetratricopeptide repeat protein [Planctomycetota bacterium]|jgi:Tfp pilus assembly protein PilF|nr:tetratricopeptide repeat protein [Planctomycetota bacterium]MDP7251495.1 tetratricopeptide repeat protein [Planctomycetota bacterium]
MKTIAYALTSLFLFALLPFQDATADRKRKKAGIEKEEPTWREIIDKQKKEKSDYRIYVARGLIQQEEGDFKKALDLYKKALKYNPKCTQAHIQSAYCQDRLGETTEAVTSLRIAVRMEEGHADAHYLLGYLYVKQYRISSAEEQLALLKKLDADKAAKLQTVLDNKKKLLESLQK